MNFHHKSTTKVDLKNPEILRHVFKINSFLFKFYMSGGISSLVTWYHIIPQLARKGKIPFISLIVLAYWVIIHHRYHLWREPETAKTAIDTKNAHLYHIHIHPLVGATKCYQAHFLSEPFLSPPTLKGKKNTAALARFFAKRWAYSGISCHPKGLGSVLKKSPKGEETRSFMVRINKLCINRQNGYISIVCMYIYIRYM